MCFPQACDKQQHGRRKGAADVGGNRDGSRRRAGQKRQTSGDVQGDGDSGDDDFAATRRTRRRRGTIDDDEAHMQTVRLLCQPHVALPQVFTFMGMGQQQRHRLIIQCKEVAKENKMEMRFRQRWLRGYQRTQVVCVALAHVQSTSRAQLCLEPH
jgi:hypothetical protein